MVKLHLGRLEFLLLAVESADPAPPELEGAVLELISEKHYNYYLIKDSKQKPSRPLETDTERDDDEGREQSQREGRRGA